MIEINLSGAEFFAFHGFYPEEQSIGSQFVVDIAVAFEVPENISEDDIANTVNYEQLYEIACDEMKQTSKLIETVAQRILASIKTQFPYLENIRVSIKKLNPPLRGKTDHTAVIMSYIKS